MIDLHISCGGKTWVETVRENVYQTEIFIGDLYVGSTKRDLESEIQYKPPRKAS